MSRIKLRTLNSLNYELSDAAVIDYIEDFPNLQAQDLLDFMNLRLEQEYADSVRSRSSTSLNEELAGLNLNLPKKQAEDQGYRPVVSVTWFCIELKQRMHFEQELMLIEAIKNYFLSIPFHLRRDWFSSVFVHGFYVYNGDYKSEMKAAAKKAGDMIAMMKSYMKSQENEETACDDEQDEYFNSLQRRVVLVALYNEKDHVQEFEKSLVESDVFVSRTIIRMNMEFNNRETLSELFEKSRQFEHYSERLFGPQEEELGEEGMNPLKFAKSVRQARKIISDNIEKLLNKTLSREEVNSLCRLYGCRDSGSLLEVSEVLLKCLQVQLELVGHGEMSQFGKDLVERIFHRYKASPESKGEYRRPATGSKEEAEAGKDYDSGLLLWEFNKLLADANCCTVYDQKEYRVIMSEILVLLDKSGNMKSEGLMHYYLNNGRIAVDNNLIGVGSLDEVLKGKFVFNCTYESDALASLLSLVGKNNILAGVLPKYIAWLCGARDIKVDGELEHFSELFDMLKYLVLPPDFTFDNTNSTGSSKGSSSSGSGGASSNPFEDIFRLLKSPGWLASTINKWSEFLADGEEGVIPTMRKKCRELFARWDQWEAVYCEELLQQTKNEVAAMEERIRNQLLAEAVRQLKERQAVEKLGMTPAGGGATVEPVGGKGKSGKQKKRVTIEESDKYSVSTADTSLVEGAAGGSVLTGSEANEAESDTDSLYDYHEDEAKEEAKLVAAAALEVKADSPYVVKTRKDGLIVSLVREALPPLEEGNTTDLVEELLQLKDDLIFLSDLVNQPHLDLTLSESKMIVHKKVSALKRIDEITVQLSRIEQQQVAHSCAAYDALRLFGRGVASAGMGTKDFCVRGSAEGATILDHLPQGLGEFAPAKQAYKEKVERAQQRKEAALAALERERIRRNMTEEEKEAIRQEQLAAQRRVWEQEEAELYQLCLGSLLNAREERKSSAELGALVKQWEDLMALKETRHPDSLQVAVCQNNLACILLEFYGLDHPLGAGSVYIFQSAVEILMKNFQAIATRWKNMPLHLMDEQPAAEAAKGVKKRVRIESFSSQVDDESSKGNVTVETSTVGPAEAQMESVGNSMSIDELLEAEEEEEEQGEGQSIQMFNNQQLVQQQDASNDNAVTVLEPQLVMPTVVILANYLTTLVEADNFTLLRQSFDLKLFTYQLMSRLSKDRDRERLMNGVIPSVASMDVFCCKKPQVSLEPIIAEIETHIRELRQREADERLKGELEAAERLSQSLRDDESSTVTSVLTKAQQKKLHKEQRAEQRRRDTIKRFETSQQRNMLYELIRTDKITKIFDMKSNAVMLANAPKWGSTSDLMLDATADLATLARTMSQPQFNQPEEKKKGEGDSDSDDSTEGFSQKKKSKRSEQDEAVSTITMSQRAESPTKRVTDYRTMAMLDQVQFGSPSHMAGVLDGDVLIQFGPISRSMPDCIQNISQFVQQSVGEWIEMTVRRDDEIVHLQIKPAEWGGRGLLGCRVTPFTSQKVKALAVERSTRERAAASPVRRGMTIVDEILDGSPASAAGLEEGDVLVEFGSVSRSTPNYLKAIGHLAGENLNEPVTVVVKRAGEFVDLSITPAEWGGRGVLGCRLTPIP